MKRNRVALAIALSRYEQLEFQQQTALDYKPQPKVKKVFRIAPDPEHNEGFKMWLSWIGYKRKDFDDGGCTFKNKKLEPGYVVIGSDLTTNQYGNMLYQEYCEHLAA